MLKPKKLKIMNNQAQEFLAFATADNQEYIDQSGQSAEEYFKTDFSENPEGYYCWMTEAEIESWESGDRDSIIASFNNLF